MHIIVKSIGGRPFTGDWDIYHIDIHFDKIPDRILNKAHFQKQVRMELTLPMQF